MEHSTGAVNWQPRNIAKRPGEMAPQQPRPRRPRRRRRRCSSSGGPPGTAPRSSTRRCCRTPAPTPGSGARSSSSAPTSTLVGRQAAPQVRADVAVVWDWESWWALELEWRPSGDLDHRERVEAYYAALWHQASPSTSPTRKPTCPPTDLVVAPALYLIGEAAAANLRRYVDGGGHLLVSYFSGIVDGTTPSTAGASPGALRDVLGLAVEEFLPLREQETVSLSGGSGSGTVWAEDIHVGSATVVSRYVDGPAASGAGNYPQCLRPRHRVVRVHQARRR